MDSPAKKRTPSRPWTAEEDRLLTQAVESHGDNTDSWALIAQAVPGRSNKACRKRWKHSLNPAVKKSPWTPEEDHLLINLQARHPCKWSVIAQHINGRTDDACAKRYREALDPTLKRDEWTEEEDQRLVKEYQKWGGRWAALALELGRSRLGCRNRWRHLQRKSEAAARREQIQNPSGTSTSAHPPPSSVYSSEPPLNAWEDAALHQFTTSTSSTVSHEPTPSFQVTLPEDSLDFDPRLYDILMGGCGCGCGSGHACTCSSHDFSAPFMDLDPQSFMGPFQAMSSLMFPPLSTNDISPTTQQTPIVPSHSGENHPLLDCTAPLVGAFSTELDTANAVMHPNIDQSSIPGRSDATLFSNSSFGCMADIPNFTRVGLLPTPQPLTSIPILSRAPTASGSNPPSAKTAIPSHAPKPPLASCCGGSAKTIPAVRQASPSLPPPPKKSCCGGSATRPEPRPTPAPSCCATVPSPSSSYQCGTKRLTSSPPGESEPNATRPKIIARPIPRLSSQLSATSDSSMNPYACGEPMCWVSDSDIRARFGTSGELLDHRRKVHGDSVGGHEKIYRCALEGCGKGWKNINGIQYHLQISKAHFVQAIKTSLASSSESPLSESSQKKLHRCTHPGCPNVYKQAAGLKYHLAHGHPDSYPAQLEHIPPRVASQLETSKKISH
ncbi:hypothetical protein BOTBODRAFT_33384 [Botryobasidium botryosum FD-172 SS1]|uniref:Uncharacterized protein n=1 Tax=Botryobasidium botryosum (strain FD-172 SS1) TaxID=930990 RepID=A0A067MP61_BOTB1|nr:hypothetical protein BOTBODRAFT_33384 [Botryobasidium botryosum FD-172 SS1]